MINNIIVLILIKLSSLVLRFIVKNNYFNLWLAELRNKLLHKAFNIKERN